MRKAGICPAFFVLFEKEQFFVHQTIESYDASKKL